MSVTPVIRQKGEVMVRFARAQEFAKQENWFAAFDELAIVLGWDWPIRGCDELLHMRLQDHMVLSLSKTKKYDHVESWCRRFLERRETPQRETPQNLDETRRALHDRRTRYIRTELASALQSQYNPENNLATGDIGKCLEAISLLENYVFDFNAAPEDELFCKTVLAECFSKVGRHVEAIETGSWVYERQASNHSQLDTKVIDARYNLAVYYLRSEEYDIADDLLYKNIDVVKSSGDQLVGATPEWLENLERNTLYWLDADDSGLDRIDPSQADEVLKEYGNELNLLLGDTLSSSKLSWALNSKDAPQERENALTGLRPTENPPLSEKTPISENCTLQSEKILHQSRSDIHKISTEQSDLVEMQASHEQPQVLAKTHQKAEEISPNLRAYEMGSTQDESPIPNDTRLEAESISPKLQPAEILSTHGEERVKQIFCASQLPVEFSDNHQEIMKQEAENALPNSNPVKILDSHDHAAVTPNAIQLPLKVNNTPTQLQDTTQAANDISTNPQIIEISVTRDKVKSAQISKTTQPHPETDQSSNPSFEDETMDIDVSPTSQQVTSSTVFVMQKPFPSHESTSETLSSASHNIVKTKPSTLVSEFENPAVSNVETKKDHLAPPTIQISGPTPPASPSFLAKLVESCENLSKSKFHISPQDAENENFRSPTIRQESQSSTSLIEEASFIPFHGGVSTPQSSAESLPTEILPPEILSFNQDLNSIAQMQRGSSKEAPTVKTDGEDEGFSDHSIDMSELDGKNTFFGAENETARDPQVKIWTKKFASVGDKLFPTSYRGAGVKIAILDTGIDSKHPYIDQKWKKPIYGKKVGDKEVDLQGGKWYKDFISKKPDPVDLDGHGTHVAGVILQFAPDAELFIARIAKSSASIAEDEGLAARAIGHAIDFWGVDIISMSFGFINPTPHELALVEKAIWRAQGERVILMAAASNNGNLSGISFPANHHYVLCINASDAYGRPLPFSPKIRSMSHDFSILGLDIMSTWPEFPKLDKNSKRKQGVFCPRDTDPKGPEGTWKCLSGTSVATPMAAALAAILFQYTRKHMEHLEPNQSIVTKEVSRYECVDGLAKIFRAMSRKDETGVHHLVPWEGDDGRFRTYDRHMTQILKSVFNIWD